MDVNDMIRDEDLLVTKHHSYGNGVGPRYFSTQSMHNIQHFVSNMVPTVKSRRPSARELNLLKRKAKISSKDQSKGWLKEGNSEELQSQEQDMTSPRGPYPEMFNLNKVPEKYFQLLHFLIFGCLDRAGGSLCTGIYLPTCR